MVTAYFPYEYVDGRADLSKNNVKECQSVRTAQVVPLGCLFLHMTAVHAPHELPVPAPRVCVADEGMKLPCYYAVPVRDEVTEA